MVCIPFDLPDARKPKTKSGRDKWHGWRTKWKKAAEVGGRPLEIILWGRSELTARLANDTAKTGGRVLYWFGERAFSKAWLIEQFEKTRAALGARYSPETSVELPVRREFLAFARDQDLQRQLDRWFIELSDKGRQVSESIVRAANKADESHSAAISVALSSFISKLGVRPVGPESKFPVEDWLEALARCKMAMHAGLDWLYSLPESKKSMHGSDPVSWARHEAYRFLELLSDIEAELASQRWRLANASAVLLTGAAGIGKSHLLADVVEHQVHLNRPAVLLLGSSFRDDEPWRQILLQLDRPPDEQVSHFLGGLDAAAEVAGTRALVCVDALNERNGIDVWPSRLASFLKAAEAFPRIGVVVSCRTTYVPFVIPSGLTATQLTVVEHDGFAVDGGEAAKVYLDKRGIIRPGAPNLVPEINNPLFLKTCCDFLEKEGKTELPRGLRGVSSIFGFYNDAVTRALNQRMRLDPRFDIIPKAISALAKRLADEGRGYLEKAKALELFESIRPSGGRLDASLLAQLESEGVLSVEPIRQKEGAVLEMVRFTFERFSDHAIADRLLTDHVRLEGPSRSFKLGDFLREYVFGHENYRRAGVIEALAIQLPEKAGVELLDTSTESNFVVQRAFKESLLWREQSHFTSRTFELAKDLLDTNELNELLIAVSSEPDNKYNARFLHKALAALSLPERDCRWSIFLAENGMSGSVETLITWATTNGMEFVEEERAYLAACMLTWLLTTTNRLVRDRATKGLACILAPRLGLAARLIDDFVGVNDPYVRERLVTASYGAAIQGLSDDLPQLSSMVYTAVFAGGHPPVDALMRESARGILVYAEWRGVLPKDVDLTRASPPYQSPWPIEFVPDELIETYKYVHPRGTFGDSIVSSTVNDGDFARYQMDHKVDNWSPAPIGTKNPPTGADVAALWHSEFAATANASQLTAFDEFVDATKEVKRDQLHTYEKTPEKERVDTTEVLLKSKLTSDAWEDFRVRAQAFYRFRIGDGWSKDAPAVFDRQWARRWVCKRAHDLGWTSERFGSFDEQGRGHSRHDHRVERIGKKYQWIALRELIARMADNLTYLGDLWERRDSIPTYTGARQVNLRDIDPSLLTAKTHYDGWRDWGRTWWVPFDPGLRAATPYERLAWLESDSDIFNDASLIEVKDPKTDQRYLALSGFAKWGGRGVRDGHEEFQRDTWFRIQSALVHKDDEEQLLEVLKRRILTDPHSLPTIELYSDFYLGEYPWHPEMMDIGDWTEPSEGARDFPVPIRATVARYVRESGGYDYSIDDTLAVEIPAPWLAQVMRLHMKDGRTPVYVDSTGQVIFFDPSVQEAGPASALVNREAFLGMLEREGLSCVWVIAGEKSAYGGQDPGRGFGGRLLHTGVYSLSEDRFVREFCTRRERPSHDQLKEFYGDTAPPMAAPEPKKPRARRSKPKKARACARRRQPV